MVSGGNRCYEPCYLELDAVGLQHHRVVLDGAADQALVACGRPEFGMEVVIVDPEQRRRCGRNEIGEIWVAGPSITQGYWNRPELTAEVFGAELVDGAGPFFRSGDLGFMHDGQLYLTGRLKDLIIVRGRNHYPHDIEASVEGCAGIRRGCTAAFAHREAPDRLEQLAVVSENTSALALTSCSPRTCSGAM